MITSEQDAANPFPVKSRSRVSVIIPNFNRETLIRETIANLLEQTAPPHEIIVVDDGSSDRSIEVIRTFGEKVILLQQPNQGPGAARNAGLRIATGEFIQFQDSDDLFSLNKLEVQARALEESEADIAFSPWVKVNMDQNRIRLENQVLQQQMPPIEPSLGCWWLRGWSTVFQSLMFRRRFLSDVGYYRTDLMPSEDSEYFFRILLRQPKITFTDECLMLYRIHSINKITQDEGTGRSRRILDWAHYLSLIIAHCEAGAFQMDLITKSLFLAGVRKHLGYLRSVSDADPEIVKSLSDQIATIPATWLSIVTLWMRLSERVRLQIQGSRWMKAYQAGPLTQQQLKLLGELGFKVDL